MKENAVASGGINMRSQQRVVSASAADGLTSGKAADAVRAADAAWLNAYTAKELDKAVAFCDEQGSMLMPNAPIATALIHRAYRLLSHNQAGPSRPQERHEKLERLEMSGTQARWRFLFCSSAASPPS